MARKISGGKYKKGRKKRLHELSGKPRLVAFGEEKKKKLKTRGGKEKTVLLSTNKVCLTDKKSNKIKVVKVKAIEQIPSNRYLKNVFIKGAIIDTELGKARVTNRPSQEGAVCAVLI